MDLLVRAIRRIINMFLSRLIVLGHGLTHGALYIHVHVRFVNVHFVAFGHAHLCGCFLDGFGVGDVATVGLVGWVDGVFDVLGH
jgi:hypothetical protein